MRKAMLFFVLSLIVCLSANAQTYKLQQFVVGSGGFVNVSAGTYRVSGISGQTAIGAFNGTSITGDVYKMYNGFWVPTEEAISGIDEPNSSKGVTNFPNPAVNFTTFKFDLESSAYVTLKVYNLTGALIATVVDGYLDGGEQRADWNLINSVGQELASGSYMYELSVNPTTAGYNTHSYALKNIIMISK